MQVKEDASVHEHRINYGIVFEVAALGLVTAEAVDVILITQETEAEKPRGCNRSVAANASQGRCVEPGKP